TSSCTSAGCGRNTADDQVSRLNYRGSRANIELVGFDASRTPTLQPTTNDYLIYLHSGVTARGRRAFHISTSRLSSLIGSGLSSTCRRSTTSLWSHTPQFFFTITMAADC